MIQVAVRSTGTFRQTLKKMKSDMGSRLDAGLAYAAQEILEISKVLVPKDIHALEESGEVIKVTSAGGLYSSWAVRYGAPGHAKTGVSTKQAEAEARMPWLRGLHGPLVPVRHESREEATLGYGISEEERQRYRKAARRNLSEEEIQEIHRKLQEMDVEASREIRGRGKKEFGGTLGVSEEMGIEVTHDPAQYAIQQHERMDFQHTEGQAHYLSDAYTKYMDRVRKAFLKGLGKSKTLKSEPDMFEGSLFAAGEGGGSIRGMLTEGG